MYEYVIVTTFIFPYSTENIPEKLNKSENWAETSFGREVMNVRHLFIYFTLI